MTLGTSPISILLGGFFFPMIFHFMGLLDDILLDIYAFDIPELKAGAGVVDKEGNKKEGR